MVVGAAGAGEGVAFGQLGAAVVVGGRVVGVVLLDAGEAEGDELGDEVVAVQLAGMREHGQAAVLRNGTHGVADVHVGDVAVADAAVLEQAAVERAVGVGSGAARR